MDPNTKFYNRTWFMWLTLFLFSPIGIFLMWKNGRFNKATRGVLSVIFGLFFIIAAITSNTTTQPTEKSNIGNTTIENKAGDTVAGTDTTTAPAPTVENPSQTNDNQATDTTQSINGQLKVHFIDVGQADSILLQQGTASMLIDAGNNADSNTVKNYISNQGITKLDYVIGTHPHEDHIGGLDYIINSFQIGKIYMPKATSTTKTFEDVMTAIQNKGMKISTPNPGDSFKLGDATVTIVAPNGSGYEDLNNYSVVVKVTFGNTSFMLDGDAEDVSENQILSKGYDIKADVLKVGHHGSSSSTTQAFLNKVNPKYAVIMVGADNTYKHPHSQTMDRLKAKGVEVYRTDENGTIVATSDGNTISFNTKPGSYSNRGTGSTSSSGGTSTGGTSGGNTGSTGGTAVTPPPTTTTPPPPTTTTPPPTTSNGTKVYWLTTGTSKSYHKDPNCQYIRGKTVNTGSIQDAINDNHDDPCNKCAM